jgi:hypothetical protein
MNGPCAPAKVPAKVVAPEREPLRKRETGQAKQIGKRGAFRRQLSHKKAQNAQKRTLRNLGVLCASAVEENGSHLNRRGTEDA